MQRYTICLFLLIALHVSDGSCAHHEELITIHTASGICQIVNATCRYRVSTIAAGSSYGLTDTRCCMYSNELLMMEGGAV